MDINQLYQEKILGFARAARQSQMPDDTPLKATVNNPACGDRVTIGITLDTNNMITAIGAEVEGCALCEAGAGYLLDVAHGRRGDDIPEMLTQFKSWLNASEDGQNIKEISPDQTVFAPVKAFTTRHTCVCLSFAAAAKALKKDA